MKVKAIMLVLALTISVNNAQANDVCDDGFCNAEINATTGVVTKTRLSDAQIKAILDKRASDVPSLPNNTAVSSSVTPSGLPFNAPEENPLWVARTISKQTTETVMPNVSSETATTVTDTATAIVDTTTVKIDSTTITSTSDRADVVATIQALLAKVFALLALLGIKG